VKETLLRAICVLLLTSSVALAAGPVPGAQAPDLSFAELLQAPEGAKAAWPSLRGKTVVVNFWATWCVPCIAELPLLNALVKSVDPAKVQLIAANFSGEDRAKIAAFLEQHPIAGWVGLDAARETPRRFGVTAIPLTFIIGPDGKVAHVTVQPETLTGEQLTALAEGRVVAFDDTVKADAALLDDQKKAAAAAETAKIAALMATNGRILATIDAPGHPAAVMLAEAASVPDDGLPADLPRTAMWGPGRLNLINGQVQDLVAIAFDDRATRVVMSGVPAGKRYNLHIDMAGGTPDARRAAIERALAAGLGLEIGRQTLSQDVLILAATPETAGHLDVSGAQPRHYCYFMPVPPDKSLNCAAGSFDDLADAVETALAIPVLNETRLDGTVTTTIPVTGQDRASAAALLSTDLGLTLTPATRPIDLLVVSAVR
jgi:thiol-disulfide isomerase/thioredoxin